ncbi:hypothetical protein WJX81_004451 [Elliptochloris bilobata]|uniref:30S ribosomal protein S16, chloroplastic n=1 Tax=Elliptochloris bilobata TaxID=381761 RepID=A0AAW1SK74_9CHLO
MSAPLAFKASVANSGCFCSPKAWTAVAGRPSMLLVENRVALRFQRFGRKKQPFYRLVAIDSRVRRDGRPLERLGYYDPLRKETNLNAPAIKKWLEVGAQPSETVGNLLRRAMIIDTPAPLRFQQPKKEEGEARGRKKK